MISLALDRCISKGEKRGKARIYLEFWLFASAFFITAKCGRVYTLALLRREVSYLGYVYKVVWIR